MLKSEYLTDSKSKAKNQEETNDGLYEAYALNDSSSMNSETTDNYNFDSPQTSGASNSNNRKKSGAADSAPSLKGVFDSPDNSNCGSAEEGSDADKDAAETKSPNDKHCHEVNATDNNDKDDEDNGHDGHDDGASEAGDSGSGASKGSSGGGHGGHGGGASEGGSGSGHGGHGGGASEGSSGGGHGGHGGHGGGASEGSSGGGHGMHGSSGEAGGHAGHGDYTEEMYGIMDSLEAYGIPVKQIVKAAFQEGKEAAGDGSLSGGAGSEGRKKREKMDNAVKAAAEEIMKQISGKLDEIVSKDMPTPEDIAFADTVASWMNLGLHSEHNNENGTGTHALENAKGEGGLAFQMAHFMNAGNDTYLGQNLRDNKGGMPSLDGESLINMVKEYKGSGHQFSENGFFGMFQSEGKTSSGDDSAMEVGDFSSYWGASGSASSKVGAGKGAVQNSFSGYDASQEL